MSFVGKILVVVQVVLSICFMALAGAVASVQMNWKTATETAKKQLAERTTELNTLQTDYKKFQDDTKAQVAKLEADANEQKIKNLNLSSTLDTLQQKFTALAETEKAKGEVASISAEEAQARRIEALLLRELLKKALEAKDAEFKQKTILEDANFEAKLEVEQLKKDYLAAQKKIKSLMDILVANNISPQSKVAEAKTLPPPDVEGRVAGTRKAKQGGEYVEVTIGSDDGLAQGHELYVYRAGAAAGGKPKYLGKILIVYTEPDRAVGTVLTKAKNGIIQAGDNVATKL